MSKINVLERTNNLEFNPVEFDGIKNEAGRTDAIQQHLNNFYFNRIDLPVVKKCWYSNAGKSRIKGSDE